MGTLVVVRGAARILALVVRKAIESSNQPSFEAAQGEISEMKHHSSLPSDL